MFKNTKYILVIYMFPNLPSLAMYLNCFGFFDEEQPLQNFPTSGYSLRS